MQQRLPSRLDAVGLTIAATRALAGAQSVREALPPLLQAVCEETRWKLGACFLVDRTAAVLRCERVWHEAGGGLDEFEIETLRSTFARGAGLPGRVWSTDTEHWISDVTRDENFPRRPAALKSGLHAAAAVPVRAGREVVAVLEFFSDEIRMPDDRLLDVLGAIASQLGQFMDRKRAEDTTHFLADASIVLGSSLDYRTTLEKLANIAVPFLCDWCAIDVDQAGHFERVAAAHVRPGKATLVVEMQKKYPPDPNGAAGYPKVMRTGEPDLYPEVPDANLVAVARDAEHLRMMREIGYRSFMCVALVARGRRLGTMTLVNCDPGRRAFRPSDLELAEDLARRAGLAIDNARLFQETQAASRRAKLLAEASRLLVESLDHRETIAKLANLVVPELGDLCCIHLVGEDGSPRPVAVAASHVDPEKRRDLEGMLRRWPNPPDAPRGIMNVVRTGQSELYPEIVPEAIERDMKEFPPYASFLLTLGPKSTLIVPLCAHGKVLGTMLFSFVRGERRFSEADVPLARDLADRVALAVSNSRLYERAELAVRAREEFLSIASHELRTPLTALQLVVRMLRMEAKPGESPEHLLIAENQLQRIGKLVATLFDISRVTAGKLAIELEDVDLAVLAKDVVARFEGELVSAGCTIEVNAASVTGRWDRFRLEQVLTNLLSNAAKYGRGKPIHVVVERGEHSALLVVRDQGTGIAPELLPRLFERFARAKGPRIYDGLGLGLYIVRQIVDALGGTITVESKPNEGATFRVELPIVPERR